MIARPLAVVGSLSLLLVGALAGCTVERPGRAAPPSAATPTTPSTATPAASLPPAPELTTPLADLVRQFDTSGLGPLAATVTPGPTAGVAAVSFAGAGGQWVEGELYTPAGPGRAPAVVLIPGTDAGFGQLADEAASWRAFGFVALALNARWSTDRAFPRTEPGDAGLLRDTIIDTRRALDLLAGRPEVDPRRLAVAGHSYGGMVAPVVGVADLRVRAAVAISAHGRSTDWRTPQFQRTLPARGAAAVGAYQAAMAPLEPATYVAKAPDRLLLIQYDPADPLMSAAKIDEYARRAGAGATVQVHQGAGHNCAAECRSGRLAWIRERLG
jgi:dienelactone hydrolase